MIAILKNNLSTNTYFINNIDARRSARTLLIALTLTILHAQFNAKLFINRTPTRRSAIIPRPANLFTDHLPDLDHLLNFLHLPHIIRSRNALHNPKNRPRQKNDHDDPTMPWLIGCIFSSKHIFAGGMGLFRERAGESSRRAFEG